MAGVAAGAKVCRPKCENRLGISMRAEIIAIGDELSTGQRLDTNSQWLAERLTELGVDVMFHTTVGDDLEANVAVFRTAIDRADVVVSTGGLGPTADDLTREAIAAATGVDLVQDEASLAHIRSLFARRGFGSMPERNVVQAMFPRGSRPVANPHGTAPGIDMTIPRECCAPCRLFALPGVPAELFVMWRETVAPAILAAQTTRRVTIHRRIKCFGAGESKLEAMLPDMIRRGREPRVGITVSDATITLRITASGPDEAACRRLIAPTEAQIRELLGVLVFGAGGRRTPACGGASLERAADDRGRGRKCDRWAPRPLAGRRRRGQQHAVGRSRAP